MFVRFRETGRRLQCSLIETRRVEGRVRHEHVASLRAVPLLPSVADRVAFWSALHQRLGKVSNRFGHETQGKILGAIAARIPMPSVEEQRQLQQENAEADERFWSSLQGMNASTAEDHRELLATTQRAIANSEAAAKSAASNAERAKERLAKIERGEDVVGGLGKPMTREDVERIMLANGWTKGDLRGAERLSTLLAELERRGIAGDYWEAWRKHREAGERRVRRAVEREVLRKHGLEWKG
jgi:hypothetical protein